MAQGQLPGGANLKLKEKAEQKRFLHVSSALGIEGKRLNKAEGAGKPPWLLAKAPFGQGSVLGEVGLWLSWKDGPRAYGETLIWEDGN